MRAEPLRLINKSWPFIKRLRCYVCYDVLRWDLDYLYSTCTFNSHFIMSKKENPFRHILCCEILRSYWFNDWKSRRKFLSQKVVLGPIEISNAFFRYSGADFYLSVQFFYKLFYKWISFFIFHNFFITGF